MTSVGGSTVVTPVPTYQEAVRPSSRPYGASGGDHVASDRSTFSVWCSIRGPPANFGDVRAQAKPSPMETSAAGLRQSISRGPWSVTAKRLSMT